MARSNKKRLLEVMGKLDRTFKPELSETTDDDWKFTSLKIEADIDGLKEKFHPNAEYVDVYRQTVNVTWHIVPEIRDYGIKSMFIVIDGISGVIYYEVVSPDENIPDEEQQLYVEKFQWEYEEDIREMVFGDGV
jgi:hypothetical protein